LVPCALALNVACTGSPEADPSGLTGLLESFDVVDSIVLQEGPPDDLIGEIGGFVPTRNGDFVIADRLRPRVRRYAPDGRLLAAQGRFGDGPFEYRRVLDLAEDERGRIWVTSSNRSHVTILDRNLEPDTLLRTTHAPTATVEAWPGQGVLVHVFSGVYGDSVQLYSADGSLRWNALAHPPEITTEPYWGSVAWFFATTSPAHAYVASSLVYPIRVLDHEGSVQAEISEPPASFQPVPRLEPGALGAAAVGGSRSPLVDWLDSFTVIAGLHVLQDSLLVVVRGRLASRPPEMFRMIQERFDLYDVERNHRVAEDVVLPEGWRILGSDAYLYVEVDGPPNPWTLLRLRPGGSLGGS